MFSSISADTHTPAISCNPTAGSAPVRIASPKVDNEQNMTIPYPHIPPVIVSIGPLAVRWYGVMYAIGYILGYRLARTRTARAILPMERTDLDSWIGYLVIGMLVGARLTYAVVYDRPAFARDPVEILRVWHGGL
ncbi:MAG: prolipoprotein diacylglyceryl transferase family protein, partial [Gemmatimonadaceae bacterium]